MDSLTQIVLGGALAAAVVPAAHRRRALVAGAVFGTVPDLDVVPLALSGVDAVTNMTWHRGPSHSVFVLALLGWLIWLLARRVWTPVREHPRRWFAAIQLALLTHPMLDAMTSYGTQLFWPIPMSPVMVSSIFIIDPLYTLPLLAAFIAVAIVGARPSARGWLAFGLVASTAYLTWSVVAKHLVEHTARETLAAQGVHDAPLYSAPTPFNTLLWQVVVLTPEGYLTAQRSLVADEGPLVFSRHASDVAAFAANGKLASVERLMWFSSGFLKAEVREGVLVLSDLRMGVEPDYSFRFEVARQVGAEWEAIPVRQLEWPWDARAKLGALWERIWSAPGAAAEAATAP